MAPDAGWSTNYLLAALTLNHRGTLHSFELDRSVRGESIERIIRRNLAPEWDQSRLVIHLGDARGTTEGLRGDIDLLFLDSAHDAEFARWYIGALFPRIRGPVMIHDIAFIDHLEPSGEADAIWNWLSANRPDVVLAGEVEAAVDPSVRRAFALRRPFRSNAVLFELPASGTGQLPQLQQAPRSVIGAITETLSGNASVSEVQQLLDEAVGRISDGPVDPFRHWDYFQAAVAYMRLGNAGDSERYLRRAIAFAFGSDSLFRRKAFRNLIDWSLERGMWVFAFRVSLVALACGDLVAAAEAGRWTMDRLKSALSVRARRALR